MADYPSGKTGKFEPGGRVVFLEDTDGDGNYDTATVVPRQHPVPDRRHCLAQGRAGLRRPGHPLRRGHRRRRQGRRGRRSSSAASAPRTTRPASTAWNTASTAGSTAPAACSAATIKCHKTGKTVATRQPRLPHQARHRRARAGDRPHAAGPRPRRLGQLVRLRQQQPRSGTTPLADHYLRRNPHVTSPHAERVRSPTTPTRTGSSRSRPTRSGSSSPARRTASPRRAASASTATTCSARSITGNVVHLRAGQPARPPPEC